MKKQRIWTGMLSTLMLCAFTVFGFAGCKDDNASASLPETPVVPPVVQEPAYDGVILKDGESYSLCANAAFLGADVVTTSETGDVEFMPVAATFTATVEPSDAPQNVTWAVAFVNPSSDWAKGKTATDYVTVDLVDESVSTEIRTVCREPFGEPIKLICTSVQNPSVTAECVLDFVQSPQNVALTFGDDLPINLGGITDILWEVNPNGIGVGGDANVDFETYTAYTIADTYTWDIDLTSPSLYKLGVIEEHWKREEFDGVYTAPFLEDVPYDAFYHDGYCVLNIFGFINLNGNTLRSDYKDAYIRPSNNIKFLTFDYSALSYTDNNTDNYTNIAIGSYPYYKTETGIAEMASCMYGISSLKNCIADADGVYRECVEEGSMFTLRLTLTGTYKTFEYISLLELEGFTNNPIAKSITLSANDYKF